MHDARIRPATTRRAAAGRAARGRAARGLVAALLVATGAAAAPARLVDRLPADAVALGAVRLDVLRTSPLLPPGGTEKLPAQAGELDDLLRDAGIDPRRDLDEIAFAFFGESAASADFVGLADGRFDRGKVEQAALGEGAVKETLGAIPVLRLPDSKNGHVAYLSFLGDLLVAGSAEGTRRAHAGPTAGPKASARFARDVPAEADLWIGADLSMVKAPPEAAAVMPAANAIRKAVLWLDASDTLGLHAMAETADAASAAQVAGMAQMFVGMASMQAASAEGVSPLSGLAVKAEGTRVMADLVLTKTQLEQLRAAAAKEAAAAQAAPAVTPAPSK